MKKVTRKKIAAAVVTAIAASVAAAPAPAQAAGGGANVIIQLPGTADCLTAQQPPRYQPNIWPVTLQTCQESRAATWAIINIGDKPGGVVLRSLATGRYLGQSTVSEDTLVQQEIPVRLDASTIVSGGKTLSIFSLGIRRLSAWFFEGAPPPVGKGWRVNWEPAEEDPVSGLQVWNLIHTG